MSVRSAQTQPAVIRITSRQPQKTPAPSPPLLIIMHRRLVSIAGCLRGQLDGCELPDPPRLGLGQRPHGAPPALHPIPLRAFFSRPQLLSTMQKFLLFATAVAQVQAQGRTWRLALSDPQPPGYVVHFAPLLAWWSMLFPKHQRDQCNMLCVRACTS